MENYVNMSKQSVRMAEKGGFSSILCNCGRQAKELLRNSRERKKI
jgi:hypothetical protein